MVIFHCYVSSPEGIRNMIKEIHKIRRFLPWAPWPIPGSSLEGCHGHDASDATTASGAQFGDLQLCTETRWLSRGTPKYIYIYIHIYIYYDYTYIYILILSKADLLVAQKGRLRIRTKLLGSAPKGTKLSLLHQSTPKWPKWKVNNSNNSKDSKVNGLV